MSRAWVSYCTAETLDKPTRDVLYTTEQYNCLSVTVVVVVGPSVKRVAKMKAIVIVRLFWNAVVMYVDSLNRTYGRYPYFKEPQSRRVFGALLHTWQRLLSSNSCKVLQKKNKVCREKKKEFSAMHCFCLLFFSLASVNATTRGSSLSFVCGQIWWESARKCPKVPWKGSSFLGSPLANFQVKELNQAIIKSWSYLSLPGDVRFGKSGCIASQFYSWPLPHCQVFSGVQIWNHRRNWNRCNMQDVVMQECSWV